MKLSLVCIATFILCLSTSTLLLATDAEDAQKAASAILYSLHSGQYAKVWDKQTSSFFKSKYTKDSFFSNMAIGRQQCGAPTAEPKFVDLKYAQSDPATGFKGEIYAFNYLSSYAAGNLYEQIVVLKEEDGKFRMYGVWWVPAPK